MYLTNSSIFFFNSFIEKWTEQQYSKIMSLQIKTQLIENTFCAPISFHNRRIKDFSENNYETQNNSWNTKNVKYNNNKKYFIHPF